MSYEKCIHHEAIEHRVDRLEDRMTRLELSIVGVLVLTIGTLASTLWATWDLPGQLIESQKTGVVQMLEKMKEDQDILLEKLNVK